MYGLSVGSEVNSSPLGRRFPPFTAAISAIFTSIGVTGSTVSKHSPQSALPVLSPPYSGFPVLHLTLQGERQTQNHPVLILPRQRSGPDSGSSLALQFRKAWRLCTVQEHRRTCPSESSPSSMAGSRRPSPQLDRKSTRLNSSHRCISY